MVTDGIRETMGTACQVFAAIEESLPPKAVCTIVLRVYREPPYAERHVRWCGRRSW